MPTENFTPKHAHLHQMDIFHVLFKTFYTSTARDSARTSLGVTLISTRVQQKSQPMQIRYKSSQDRARRAEHNLSI